MGRGTARRDDRGGSQAGQASRTGQSGNAQARRVQTRRDLCIALREHVALMTDAERRCVLAAIRQRPSARPETKSRKLQTENQKPTTRPAVPAQAAQLALILE